MKFSHVDIHSHVSFKEYDVDRAPVLARMREAGVATITVGVDLASSTKAVELASKEEGVFATIGLHPADNTAEEFDARAFGELVKNEKVVAIGECGLDFYRLAERDKKEQSSVLRASDAAMNTTTSYRRDGISEVERARQKKELDAQIAFALEHDKPLMIHCRAAHEEMLETLTQYKRKAGEKLRGNIHFFTAPLSIAKRYNDLGFTISFPGVITFAREYDDAVRSVPLSMMMVETDAPFASPVPFRGKRNEPSYVLETIRKIAELRGQPFEDVGAALRETTKRVLGV